MNDIEFLTFYRNNLRQALGRGGKALLGMQRALNEYGEGMLDCTDVEVKVWSDLHIGHEKIIPYTKRPFVDVAAMDATLWANWESGVGPHETIVCVGDLALDRGTSTETWTRVRSAPGRHKILVVGNHDLTSGGRLRVEGFDEVFGVMTSGGEPPLIWTHAPLPEVPNGYINVHGHIHSQQVHRSPHINVSVEQLDYRPVSLPRIRRLAKFLVAGHYPAGRTTRECIEMTEAGGPV